LYLYTTSYLKLAINCEFSSISLKFDKYEAGHGTVVDRQSMEFIILVHLRNSEKSKVSCYDVHVHDGINCLVIFHFLGHLSAYFECKELNLLLKNV